MCLGQHLADHCRRVLGNARPEAEIRARPFEGDELQMRILGDPLERLQQRPDHLRRDDVPLGMEQAEGGAGLSLVEGDVDRIHAGCSCAASAAAVVTGSRQAKSRQTKAAAAPFDARMAAMKGSAAAIACWRSPGVTGMAIAKGR